VISILTWLGHSPDRSRADPVDLPETVNALARAEGGTWSPSRRRSRMRVCPDGKDADAGIGTLRTAGHACRVAVGPPAAGGELEADVDDGGVDRRAPPARRRPPKHPLRRASSLLGEDPQDQAREASCGDCRYDSALSLLLVEGEGFMSNGSGPVLEPLSDINAVFLARAELEP
jgi:hypothetical protein